MERRKAITTAATASLTLLAGAAGIALNSGIVGGGDDDDVGQISLVGATSTPTVYLEDSTKWKPGATPPVIQLTDGEPVASSTASGYEDSDHDDDLDSYEESDHDGHDDDHDEYEGADDDD